jgi:hypothetical protein
VEVSLLIAIILLVIIFSIAAIMILGMIFGGYFAEMGKEICLLTVGKLFAYSKVCEIFIRT